MTSRTVQIHLNRHCNLACAHCYSQSGPREREQLAPDDVIRFLGEARAQGYSSVAFSGGEPFLYPYFEAVLDSAEALGMRRLVVTNGTVLMGGRERLINRFDMIAVSVDGPEDIHNQLRRSPTAYARMCKGLEMLRVMRRSNDAPFGIAHTVTRESLPHLPDIAEFAVAAGASILQLHPIGMVGAAETMTADTINGTKGAHRKNTLAKDAHGRNGPQLDGATLARAYLTAMALQNAYGDTLTIHVDMLSRHAITASSALVIPGEGHCTQNKTSPSLSDYLNPLVVMANGDVSPICHAMPDHLRLGNINNETLQTMTQRFRGKGLTRLQQLCRMLRDEVIADTEGWPWLNWYELLEVRSHMETDKLLVQNNPGMTA